MLNDNIFIFLFIFFFFYTNYILTSHTKSLSIKSKKFLQKIKLTSFLLTIRSEFFYNSKNVFSPFKFFKNGCLYIKYSLENLPFSLTENKICIRYYSKNNYVYKFVDKSCDGKGKTYKLFKGDLKSLDPLRKGVYILKGYFEKSYFEIKLKTPFENFKTSPTF